MEQFFNFKITDDCNKQYGCFRSPNECVNASCDYLAKWKVVENENIEFLLSTKSSANKWLGIGFSTDELMVNK